MYNRIQKLCKENDTTITSLCETITGSRGNLSTWKKGHIRSDYLLSISQYFDVSSDYLLGLDDIPSRKEHLVEVKSIDKRAFDMFSSLSELNKGIIIGRMEEMLAEDNKSKNAEAI